MNRSASQNQYRLVYRQNHQFQLQPLLALALNLAFRSPLLSHLALHPSPGRRWPSRNTALSASSVYKSVGFLSSDLGDN